MNESHPYGGFMDLIELVGYPRWVWSADPMWGDVVQDILSDQAGVPNQRATRWFDLHTRGCRVTQASIEAEEKPTSTPNQNSASADRWDRRTAFQDHAKEFLHMTIQKKIDRNPQTFQTDLDAWLQE